MIYNLSDNEIEVIKIVYNQHDPEIDILCSLLQKKLKNRDGKIIREKPDPRYTSKLKSTGVDKIYKSLKDYAKTMRLEISSIDNLSRNERYQLKVKGVIKGFNFIVNTTVYLIFTFERGIIAWYVHESKHCKRCVPDGECEQLIELIAKERGYYFPQNIKSGLPDKKSEWLFEQILNQ